MEQPDHPGVAHYLIHSNDYPALAEHGLDAALRYADIAPAAPHALHMPSHIFTRLGYWQESIDTNMASANAAKARLPESDRQSRLQIRVARHGLYDVCLLAVGPGWGSQSAS